MVAGSLIGLERTYHDRPAGFRTPGHLPLDRSQDTDPPVRPAPSAVRIGFRGDRGGPYGDRFHPRHHVQQSVVLSRRCNDAVRADRSCPGRYELPKARRDAGGNGGRDPVQHSPLGNLAHAGTACSAELDRVPPSPYISPVMRLPAAGLAPLTLGGRTSATSRGGHSR